MAAWICGGEKIQQLIFTAMKLGRSTWGSPMQRWVRTARPAALLRKCTRSFTSTGKIAASWWGSPSRKLYGEDAASYIMVMYDGIHGLFHDYITQPVLGALKDGWSRTCWPSPCWPCRRAPFLTPVVGAGWWMITRVPCWLRWWGPFSAPGTGSSTCPCLRHAPKQLLC